MSKNKKTPDKKRHHVVPVTYLKGFVDSSDKLHAYRKDEPTKPLHVIPESIGFRKYYYSQPIPGGGWDHNTLEDFFSDFTESKWNSVVKVIREEKALSKQQEEVLFQFMGAMRVRVPAARDAIEYMLAEQVKTTALLLDESGALPPKPEGHEDILDHVAVSIDPHKSIHAMADMMKGFAVLLGMVGFEIIKNTSNVSFITSDNPVLTFDPDIPELIMRPYTIDRVRRRAEIIFPIDSQHVFHGHSDLKKKYDAQGITYIKVNDSTIIARINRLVSRFAYELAFANDESQGAIIEEYAHVSPVTHVDIVPQKNGKLTLSSFVFGPRRKKTKWEETRE